MKLWHVSQSSNQDYDTFDSMVVVAETADDAVLIHPRGGFDEDSPSRIPMRWSTRTNRWAGFIRGEWDEDWYDHTWTSPENCKAVCVGVANPDARPGTVLIASFNAG